MEVLVVDDEPLARARLVRMIEHLPGYSVSGAADDGATALARAREQQPAIVLLDIYMPGTDGLQVDAELAALSVPPAVVFTTAHMEHALSAHRLAVSGYLLKPVKQDELALTLAQARRPSRAQMAALTDRGGLTAAHFVSARTPTGQARVPLADVIYFRADQKYTTVCHMHGELLIDDALSTLEQRFGNAFVRVHRKALVARRYIMALERAGRGQMQIRLRHCDHVLAVSRRRLAAVRQCLSRA